MEALTALSIADEGYEFEFVSEWSISACIPDDRLRVMVVRRYVLYVGKYFARARDMVMLLGIYSLVFLYGQKI
jgi:hypothetical protein